MPFIDPITSFFMTVYLAVKCPEKTERVIEHEHERFGLDTGKFREFIESLRDGVKEPPHLAHVVSCLEIEASELEWFISEAQF